MNQLPQISPYGNYSNSNYGTHALEVNVGSLTLYFSYQTIVAFCGDNGLKVRRNDWGPTTGKHLNAIDGGDKKTRLSSDDFEAELLAVLAAHNLTL
jgi:hypothetical protein